MKKRTRYFEVLMGFICGALVSVLACYYIGTGLIIKVGVIPRGKTTYVVKDIKDEIELLKVIERTKRLSDTMDKCLENTDALERHWRGEAQAWKDAYYKEKNKSLFPSDKTPIIK